MPLKKAYLYILIIILFSQQSIAQIGKFTTENLRCENTINPIGIDAMNPRLSWMTISDERNWNQGAYQILVASSKENLDRNIGDLWDSGVIKSAKSNLVNYQGKLLQSRNVYYWKVKVWDTKLKNAVWSTPAFWEMGILTEADWQAKWIGRHNNSFDDFDNQLTGADWIWSPKNMKSANISLKKEFNINSSKKIKSAYLLFTADQFADVFINGELVYGAAGKGKFEELKKVNVVKFLMPKNTIEVFAKRSESQGGFIGRLKVTYQDDETLILKSDTSWVVSAPEAKETQAVKIAGFGEKPWTKVLAYAPLHSEPAPYLRKDFDIKGSAIKRARIYFAAPGWAEIQVNGKKAGGERLRDPGYTRFDKRILYTTYDVTNQIKTGKNAIGAILGTGWYDTHDLAVWNLETAPWRGRPRLKLQLFIEYANGKSQTIVSDDSWKATTGPILADGIYAGTVYDANKELGNWSKADFKENGWERVTLMPNPGGKMVAMECPPVAVSRKIKPVAITEPKPGVYVIDMGENFSGHAQISMSAPKGTKMTMKYAELLKPDGTIERGNIMSFMAFTHPEQYFQTDVYIFKGQGIETWEQQFSYYGFRYIEITGLPSKPALENFTGKFTHTNFEQDGKLETSNSLINDIHKIVIQAYLSNAQNIPTDCPQREKNGWTGDAHLAAETGIMNFNTLTFYEKFLDDNYDAMMPDGELPVIIPSANWGLHWDPEWNSAYHLIAWYLYQYYGDDQVLAKHYDKLKLYVDNLALKRKNGLTGGFTYGDWAFYDTQTSKKLTANAYLFLDAQIIANAAKVLGNNTDVLKYQALADDVKKSYNAAFLNRSQSTYDNGSQTALATSLYFDLVPEDMKQEILKTLVKNIDSSGHIDAGILGTKHLLRTLSDYQETDVAFKLVDNTRNPGWGYLVKQGATALPGGWGREGKPSLGSQNHIMFGDVDAWFYRDLAGIKHDPESVGFKHFFIKPEPQKGLDWVKASYQSAYGLIKVEWKKASNKWDLDVDIPANTSATIIIPAKSVNQILLDGKKISEAIGILSSETKESNVQLKAGSGIYHFEIYSLN